MWPASYATYVGRELLRLVVGHGLKQRQCALSVAHGIERRHAPVLQARGLAVLQPLIQKFGVFLLDMRRIAQHPVAQIDGGGSGIDRAREPVLHQRGQVPRVVDVGVRQYHRLDGRAAERQAPVLLIGVFSPPLIQPAIQQEPFAARFHQVHRPRDRSRCTPERKLHGLFSEG
jgi:hypothetical protein